MPGPRRGPGARPAAGSGTTRRPSTPGGGRTPRRASTPARTAERTRVGPAEPGDEKPARGSQPRPSRAATAERGTPPRRDRPARTRPSITSRAAVLALVVAVLLVSYAYPLRTWYEQHRERAALEAEASRLRSSVDELEAELRRWDDPTYIAARARERLNFVLPGEQGYVVVPDPAAEAAADQPGPDGLPPAGEGEWYERLWSSVEAADAVPPAAAPDSDADSDSEGDTEAEPMGER